MLRIVVLLVFVDGGGIFGGTVGFSTFALAPLRWLFGRRGRGRRFLLFGADAAAPRGVFFFELAF